MDRHTHIFSRRFTEGPLTTKELKLTEIRLKLTKAKRSVSMLCTENARLNVYFSPLPKSLVDKHSAPKTNQNRSKSSSIAP